MELYSGDRPVAMRPPGQPLRPECAQAELKNDDPPLIRLKKERFNAAAKEAKARSDLFNRGLTRIPELIDVAHRLFAAEVDLYDQAEQKAQVLQRQLDVYTEAESNLEKWVKDGMATEADLERLRYDKDRRVRTGIS
jgi:hypothetical protein